MEEIQSDLRMALDILEVNTPLILVGHSFGGAVAVSYTHLTLPTSDLV